MSVRVRVTNVPPGVTTQRFHDLVDPHFRTTRITVPTDPTTGANRGFAYLYAENDADAQKIADMLNGFFLDGQTITAQLAPAKRKSRAIPAADVALFNLPAGTDEREILDWLTPDWPVQSIHIVTPKAGSAADEQVYITLRDKTVAAEMIAQLAGAPFRERVIRARPAVRRVPPTQRGLYTLDIPGIQDFIRIPKLEERALREERVERLRSHRSTIAPAFDWIPGVINWLDDTQDLLFTFLVLSKPLLRRLPARLIPGAGWVLLANDILNLTTGLLAAPLTGRAPKRAAYALLDLATFGRARRIEKFATFMSATNWVGFGFQAAQALRNISSYLLTHFTDEGTEALAAGKKIPGFGLSLGAAMGLASELVWAPIRLAGGDQVIIRMPPPHDPLGKAVRWLEQAFQYPLLREGLSNDDHLLVSATYAAATAIVRDARLAPSVGDVDRNTEGRFRTFQPWNEASLYALETLPGYSIFPGQWSVSGKDGGQIIRDGVLSSTTIPTSIANRALNDFDSKLDVMWRYQPDRWERHAAYMRDAFGPTSLGTLTSLLTLEASNNVFAALDPAAEPKPNFYAEELAAMHAIEYGILPRPDTPPELVVAYLAEAVRIAHEKGHRAASTDDLIEAAKITMGGFDLGINADRFPSAIFEGSLTGPPLPPDVTPPGVPTP